MTGPLRSRDKVRLGSVSINSKFAACVVWCAGRDGETIFWDPANMPLSDYSIIPSKTRSVEPPWEPEFIVKADALARGVLAYCGQQSVSVIIVEDAADRLPLSAARIVHGALTLLHCYMSETSRVPIYVPNWSWAASMTSNQLPTMMDVLSFCSRMYIHSLDVSLDKARILGRAIGTAFGVSAEQLHDSLEIYEKVTAAERKELL